MVKRVFEAAIRRVKGDPGYTVAPGITATDLAVELRRRAVALVRAQVQLAGVPGGHVRFVESGCSIAHRRHLSIGNGSILEHGSRLSCLSRRGFAIGRNVTIGKFAIIECTGVLWNLGEGFRIGDRSSVGDYTFIGCGGGVDIGSDVLMGQRVAFHSQNHLFDGLDVPIAQQGVTNEGITVGDNCWIGSGSILLDGVQLGDGCVVAAGSVVTKSFPSNTVIAGSPARAVRHRGSASDEL